MSDSRLVYSTENGGDCPRCGRPLRKCTCQQNVPAKASDGIVRVSRQTKGRKGKQVVMISGVPDSELKRIGKLLQTACGAGGSIEDSAILIQGDQRDKIRTVLESQGFNVKLAGG